MPCPYVSVEFSVLCPYDADYAVDVVWHYYVFTKFDIIEMSGNCEPAILYDASVVIQDHFVFDDVAEETCFVVGADGDIVPPGFGVIETPQAY